MATAGSDGTISIWDKDSRQRLKPMNSLGGPVTAITFNKGGNLLAYAVSYDWHKV